MSAHLFIYLHNVSAQKSLDARLVKCLKVTVCGSDTVFLNSNVTCDCGVFAMSAVYEGYLEVWNECYLKVSSDKKMCSFV